MLKSIIFTILLAGALVFFVISCINLIKNMQTGKKKDDRSDKIGERIKRVLIVAFGQSKILRDPNAGILHFIIFWGFVLFLFAVIESIIQGFNPNFTFESAGPLYSAMTIIQDVLGLLVVLSVLYALYRRYVVHVPRLEVGKHGKIDATIILLMIMFVVVFMFLQNTAMIAKHNFILSKFEIRPLSYPVSKFLFNGNNSATLSYEVFWWAHIIVVLAFLNFLPYSKHLHVLTSIPNTYLANIEPEYYNIKPLNLDDENAEFFGAADIEHLSWKQIFDGYTCTECGRCTAACPAANVGKSLSPRKIITDIRHRTHEKAPLLRQNAQIGKENTPQVLEKTLVHDYIADIELWECTTCGACMKECPVMIEHLDSIIDMRRNLVLSESQFPSGLNNVFRNIEVNFTPWAFNPADRAAWAEGMNIKTMAEDPNGEVLFWVGCAGSFDDRYKKVTKAFASIMQKAGIDFRILGTEEKCNGDVARRLGNEYLAQTMMKENIEKLNGYGVKKIVTACPHCFQSIGREYKQFGGDYEVIHHTQFISDLLKENKIELKDEEIKEKFTYHDSCYLGRYNDIYEEPRDILKNIKGSEVVEMQRNKSKGFCCGAGGGRMFLEDEEGDRINVERTGEALSVTPNTIASACPFCMTMLTDGVKHFEKTEDVSVKDIAEIVLENIK
ncbi:MAG TPA: (Fe-S)-binding protein [Ignavibacteriaceae bacterium]|nr:(Fe-S)-binding protein [Ignavibacteriaceae bacterium]